MEVAALKLGYHNMDTMSDSQVQNVKQTLIAQKPLSKFYWSSEYSQNAAGVQVRRHLDHLLMAGRLGCNEQRAGDPAPALVGALAAGCGSSGNAPASPPTLSAAAVAFLPSTHKS